MQRLGLGDKPEGRRLTHRRGYRPVGLCRLCQPVPISACATNNPLFFDFAERSSLSERADSSVKRVKVAGGEAEACVQI